MTLRESLGDDVRRIHDQVDALLDSEDGLLVLFDGGRMVSYAEGFGVSASQLELLSDELERAVRNVVGRQPATNRRRRNRENGKQDDDGGGNAVLRQHVGRHGRGDDSGVVDGGDPSDRPGDSALRDRRRAPGRVLRMASKTA